jgi:hypothetical protein
VRLASARDDTAPRPDRQLSAFVESPVGPASPWGGLEIATVILLGLEAVVIPILGPLVGLILLWSSSQMDSPAEEDRHRHHRAADTARGRTLCSPVPAKLRRKFQ